MPLQEGWYSGAETHFKGVKSNSICSFLFLFFFLRTVQEIASNITGIINHAPCWQLFALLQAKCSTNELPLSSTFLGPIYSLHKVKGLYEINSAAERPRDVPQVFLFAACDTTSPPHCGANNNDRRFHGAVFYTRDEGKYSTGSRAKFEHHTDHRRAPSVCSFIINSESDGEQRRKQQQFRLQLLLNLMKQQ